MFIVASLPILLLALSITGSPVGVRNSSIVLPLIRRPNLSNGTINLLQHDKARAAAFRGHNFTGHNFTSHNFTSHNFAGHNLMHGRRDKIPAPSNSWDYVVEIGVGSPQNKYSLAIDTSSSNTWLGASGSTPYVETSTSTNTNQPVEVTYTDVVSGPDSSFSGTIYLDSVTINNLTVPNFPIGVASTSTGISTDGVLGLGPQDLTLGTLTNQRAKTFQTFPDYLYNQGAIGQNLVGIFFAPLDKDPSINDWIAFGEVDASEYLLNEITYVPTTTTTPACDYWGIDQSIIYGPESILILDTTAGIIDSGSSFIAIASDAFANYQTATGATMDQTTGLLTISSDQYDALQDLYFIIAGVSFTLVPNGQIWPRSMNYKLNGADGAIYLIITDIGSPSGSGLDFINGYTFIQRFYTVFDGTNSQVGFALTMFTLDIDN